MSHPRHWEEIFLLVRLYKTKRVRHAEEHFPADDITDDYKAAIAEIKVEYQTERDKNQATNGKDAMK